jgi:hypothetical protein
MERVRIVFFAPLGASFGEALQGVRLAADWVKAGHDAVFLAPAGLAPALSGSGLRFGRIDAAVERGGAALLQAVHEVARGEQADALVLLDLAAVAQACAGLGVDFARLVAPGGGVKVLALDAWDLAAAGPRFDLGPESISIETEAQQIDPGRRLVPVPFARPGAQGAYRALPAASPLHPVEREIVRADLGIAAQERLVLLCTARWQHEESQDHPDRRRRCRAVAAICAAHLARLGPRVRVLHIGPAPIEAPDLGRRYRHLPQVAPADFAQILGAADLLVSWNAAATTLGTAIAARLPVLLLSAEAGLPGEGVPLYAAPLSLAAPLRQNIEGNPLYAAPGPLRRAELLDDAAVLAAADALLFDEAAFAAARAAQGTYQALVEALPSGVERLRACLHGLPIG